MASEKEQLGTIENADAAMTRAILAQHSIAWMLTRVDQVRRELKMIASENAVVREGSYRLTTNMIHSISSDLAMIYTKCLDLFDAIEANDEDYEYLNNIASLLERPDLD